MSQQNLDFRFNGEVPFSSIIDSVAQKSQRESSLHNDALQRGQNVVSNIQQAAETTSKMVSDMVARAKHKQQADATKSISELASMWGESASQPATTMKPGASSFFSSLAQVPTQEETTYGQTPEAQAQMKSLLFKAAPDVALKQAAEQAFSEKGLGGATGLSGNAAKPQQLALELPDGTQVLGSFNPTLPIGHQFLMQNGQEAPPGSKRSYKFDIRNDSEGNVVFSSGSSGKKVGGMSLTSEPSALPENSVTSYAQLPPVVRKEVVASVNTAQSDPAIKGERVTYVNMNRLYRSVESGNKALTSKLGLVFQRAMGDSGNMTAMEQRMPGSRQLVDQGFQLFDTYIRTGVLTPENKKIVLDAVDLLKGTSLENYNTLVENEAEQLTAAYPQLNRDYIRKNIGGSLINDYEKYKAGDEITPPEKSTKDTRSINPEKMGKYADKSIEWLLKRKEALMKKAK